MLFGNVMAARAAAAGGGEGGSGEVGGGEGGSGEGGGAMGGAEGGGAEGALFGCPWLSEPRAAAAQPAQSRARRTARPTAPNWRRS